jgi:tripartite-type tricarboxylate transporter receptor subunit TctC
MARLIGEHLARSLGKPVTVDNRTGAAGALGVAEVAKAAPDGYTLALPMSDSLLNNVVLFKSLPYRPERDLTFLTQVVFSPALLSAHADLPVKNMAEFVRYAAEHRGQLSYGSWGVGGLAHIAGEALNRRLDARMVHVPQRGEASVMNDILGHTVDIGFTSAGLARQYIAAGRIRPLALLGRERSKVLPQVPTMREQGFDDPIFDASVWLSMVGPANLPPAIADRLTAEIRTILGQPEVAAAVADRGLEVMATTPQQFHAAYAREMEVIRRKIQEIGIEASQ